MDIFQTMMQLGAISKIIDTGLQNVLLGHLSKESNFPELAYKTVSNELMRYGINAKDLEINVASRIEPSKVVNI